MKRKRKNYSGTLEMKLIPYLFIAPNTLIFFCFVILPAIFGCYYSLTDWKGIGEPAFIGLANYAKVLADTKFWDSMLRTCTYVILALPLIMTIPLLLANLMIKEIRCRGLYRAIFYWPSMISYIVVGVSFRFIFGDDTGIINYLLSVFGDEKIDWLTNGTLAMLVVVLANVWSRSGFYMIMYITGLQNISVSMYEASEIDGANARQQFWRITLPLLRPTTFLVMMLGLIDLFKAYGLVISLTGGGPVSATKFAVQYIYEKAFNEMNMGYASALSMVMMIIIALFTSIQFLVNKGGRVNA